MCTHSNDDHRMSTSAGNLYQDYHQLIVLKIDGNQQAKIIKIFDKNRLVQIIAINWNYL